MEAFHYSPRELLVANKWSSLLFTTYSLSLSFLESVPLAAVSKSFKSFTVLADLEGYLTSLSDVGAIGVGRDYDLVPIQVVGGVFHPKICLLADEDGNIRATVGSGNLSFGGWGFNNEVVEVLRPGVDSQCFADIAEMLGGISEGAMDGRLKCLRDPGLERYIDLATKASLVPGLGASRVLHTLSGPLLPQIKEMADALGGAQRLHVVSPFFSSYHGVKNLAEVLQCTDVSVAVPAIAPSIFDFAAAAGAGFHVSRVTSDRFEDERSLHSKLYDIECARGRLLLSGSANASLPALLGKNVEAVVARPVDLASSLGWRPTTRTDGVATDEREPIEASGGGLVADFMGGSISGRVLLPSHIGEWQAYLAWGTRRETLGSVYVGATGVFALRPSSAFDPISLGSAAQLIFMRGAMELRGWIILRDLLTSINRRGPIARVIGRILGGLGSVGDDGLLLDYLAHDPAALFEAAVRSGGGRTDRRKATEFGPGALSALQASSALDMPSSWSGGAPGHSGDALIDALVRHLASVMPAPNDDAMDDDDEEDPAHRSVKQRKTETSPTRRGKRLQRATVERAFERLFAQLAKYPPGPDRAPGLFMLFDMIIKIAPNTEKPDELLPALLLRWLHAAERSRPLLLDSTSLDQCVSIVVARITIQNPTLAPRMHALLQSWVGGELEGDFKQLFEPAANGFEERRVYPDGLAGEWQQAWADIMQSETPWSKMQTLRQAILVGKSNIEAPDGATPMEVGLIRSAAMDAKSGKVVYITSTPGPSAACPRCNIGLPSDQRWRLSRHRIASCVSGCGRVVIDVSL